MAQIRITDYSTDPVLPASDFRCDYFGRDLLEMLETIVTFARDHVVPWCRGGSDGTCNRAAACAACDAPKADFGTKSIEHAWLLVQLRRDRMATTYLALPDSVRGRPAGGMGWGMNPTLAENFSQYNAERPRQLSPPTIAKQHRAVQRWRWFPAAEPAMADLMHQGVGQFLCSFGRLGFMAFWVADLAYAVNPVWDYFRKRCVIEEPVPKPIIPNRFKVVKPGPKSRLRNIETVYAVETESSRKELQRVRAACVWLGYVPGRHAMPEDLTQEALAMFEERALAAGVTGRFRRGHSNRAFLFAIRSYTLMAEDLVSRKNAAHHP